MFSVKMPLFAAITAAMILTVDATSKSYVRKTLWSSAGCTTSADIISDNINPAIMPSQGCMAVQKATASSCDNDHGVTTCSNKYEKVTCTANTATTGFTKKKYSDSACTTDTGGAIQASTGTSTGACVQDGANQPYVKYTCDTTSATVGLVPYGLYSAAGCADDQLKGAGSFLVNSCSPNEEGIAWNRSDKYVIENGKFKQYRWTNTANKDCSGTGTEITSGNVVIGCEPFGSQWIKVGAMIDGANIAGASTLSGASSSGVQAPLKITTVFLALVLAVGLVFHQ